MTAYLIANLRVRDAEGFGKYVDLLGPNFAKSSGTVLAVDPTPDKTEGDWPYNRTVILEFPSKEEARGWYDSAEYQEIAKLRHAAAEADAAIIDGRE